MHSLDDGTDEIEELFRAAHALLEHIESKVWEFVATVETHTQRTALGLDNGNPFKKENN